MCDIIDKKKQRVEVTLQTKLNAIRELDKGTSIDDIAKELKVHHTTVRLWKKNKNKIISLVKSYENLPKKRKRIIKNEYSCVNKALWSWFCQKRKLGVPLSGSMLKAQALRFYKMFYNDNNFKASNGWLRSWQQLYGVRSISICGEKLSADKQAVEPFQEKFLQYVRDESLTADQVFNADESRLVFKLLSNVSLCSTSEEKPSGLKSSKEGLSIMACANASGTFKLPLVVIGKSARPRALKNIKSLPVSYKHQNKAWMTKELFSSWFENEFIPQVKTFLQSVGLPCKALLCIDNCSSHALENLSKDGVSIMFFPPNTTSLIQPMDQGCLQNLKLLYKKHLMDYILDSIEKNNSLQMSIKKISIREVINWAADSWSQISADTIKKSWNKVWPWENRIEMANFYHELLNRVNAQYDSICRYLNTCSSSLSLFDINKIKDWIDVNHLTEESLTDAEIVEIAEEKEQVSMDVHHANCTLDILDNEDGEASNENEMKISCNAEEENSSNNKFESVFIDPKYNAEFCLNYLKNFCRKHDLYDCDAPLEIVEETLKNM